MKEHKTFRTKKNLVMKWETLKPAFYFSCYLVRFSLVCHPTLNTNFPHQPQTLPPCKRLRLASQGLIRNRGLGELATIVNTDDGHVACQEPHVLKQCNSQVYYS